jgi:thiosulfate/3-mercaptopyruvate sulfurtransferase
MKHGIWKWLAATSAAALCLCQQGPDPWPASAFLEPAELAKVLQSSPEKAPKVICVAFPVLYKAKHISHSSFAGPGSKAEGLEALKKAVAGVDKSTEIVLYCGCCPMDHCPNIRPAYRVLAELGYTKVRVLNIATNTHTDWSSKNYPTESASDAPK